MNCKKCGAPLMDSDDFCKTCGAARENVSPAQNVNVQGNEFNQVPNQPVQPQQFNNGYGQMPNQNNPYQYQQVKPNSNNLLAVIIGIVVVAIIAVAAVIVVPKFTGDDSSNNGTSADVSDNSGSKVNKKNDDNKVVATYTTTYGNFTFKVPTDLIVEKSEDFIIFYDATDTWVIYLDIVEGNFNVAKSNATQIKDNFIVAGYNVKNSSVKTIDGIEFITLEVEDEIAAYASLPNNYIAVLDVINSSYTFDYSIISKVTSVISSAKYNASSNSISTGSRLNLKNIKLN